LAKMDSEREMKLVYDAKPDKDCEYFGAREKWRLQNASDFRLVLGGSDRRRTPAGTLPLDGRDEGGRRLVEKWRTQSIRPRKRNLRLFGRCKTAEGLAVLLSNVFRVRSGRKVRQMSLSEKILLLLSKC
jgi:hypothetical protein